MPILGEGISSSLRGIDIEAQLLIGDPVRGYSRRDRRAEAMLQSGARVRVHGLQAAAAQRHNGAEAIVVEHAAATERATVRLLSGEVLRAKPTNLAPRTDCSLCKKASNALKACSQCGIASYCSKQCQVRRSLRFCVPRSQPDAEGVLAIPRR